MRPPALAGFIDGRGRASGAGRYTRPVVRSSAGRRFRSNRLEGLHFPLSGESQ